MDCWERKPIAYRVIGKRMIMGAEWPVENACYRDAKGKAVVWIVAFGLCNGIARHSLRYKTKTEALEAMNA